MECKNCGHGIADGVAFCPYCGAKVAENKPEEDKPIYVADVKGMLKSGKLAVYRDRVEFSTSNVQKTVFNYSALVSVKKGLDRIFFITEDGRTESCTVNMKMIHEAFLYIEKASKPYIEERKKRLLTEGIRYSFVSNLGLSGGILNITDDRADFRAKSGQGETVLYKDVKSVGISMGMLEFSLTDGRSKSFTIGKDIRDEVLAFVEKAIVPYIAERKEALLAKGIYFSCLSGQGLGSGTLDVLSDRVEYKAKSGQSESVLFKDVRKAGLSMGTLELSMTDGTTRSYAVEEDIREDVLAFVENAIRPYVLDRTVGFDTVFGIDEKIEINEERGVFHIIRQGGNEITGEYPMGDVVQCEWRECSEPGSMLGGVLSGGMAIINSAAKAVGTQGVPNTEDKISYVAVFLTIRNELGTRRVNIRFGDFTLGMSRANKKYEKYLAEIARFTDYLSGSWPKCEIVARVLPEAGSNAVEITAEAAEGKEEAYTDSDAAAESGEKDQFGIIKYIEGVSGFIAECTTPMTIAIQGSLGSGKNSIMKMISNSLEEHCRGNLIWFNVGQFSQSDSGEQLPLLVGNRLVSQLNGANGPATKDRAIKVAKGLISITSGLLSQGSTAGKELMEGLFKEDAANSPDKLMQAFSELVRERTVGENGKVPVFIEDLDRLTPARGVEVLEALRGFFECEGCVFVINVDYNFVIRGAKERYGKDFDDNAGKRFFDKLFQVSFRVPVSGYNIQNYAKDKLEHIDIYTEDEEELGFYVELIRHSVGGEPRDMDRLFNSFLLLKKLADPEMYESKYRRLMLFSLLCMQTRFRDIYDYIVRVKDKVTPDFLLGLCSGQPEGMELSWPNDDEKTKFCDFAKVFCDIINTDGIEHISESECSVFAEVLDFSSITSK
ncbi:MAG: P-loop NTPase fold protein [bacterium]|nr:P-loop NTPase fold protein [bacterium]